MTLLETEWPVALARYGLRSKCMYFMRKPSWDVAGADMSH